MPRELARGRVVLHHAERVELGAELEPESWNARSAAATSASLPGSRSSSAVSSRPLDEAGHQAGRVLDVGGHGGRDPEVGGRLLAVHSAARSIPSSAGVLARQADHVVGASEPHAEVAVRDSSVERGHRALARAEERGHARHHLGQLGNRDLLVHSAATATVRPRPGQPRTSCPRCPGRWRCPSFG